MKTFLIAIILALCSGCNAFNVSPVVPVMDKYAAVENALQQVLDWAREHRGETQTILDMGSALNAHDYVAAFEDAKTLMLQSATAGDAPPQEIVAIVTLLEDSLKK